QPVLVAVLDEAAARVNHKNPTAGAGGFLVGYEDARRDARAIKQIGRQSDDALQIAGADEPFPNDGLGVAAKEYAVRQNAGGFPLAFHRADDVQQVSVIALPRGRHAPGEALVMVQVGKDAGTPRLVRERRIGDDVIVSAQPLAVLEFG